VPSTLPRPALPVTTTPPIEAKQASGLFHTSNLKSGKVAKDKVEHPDKLTDKDGGLDKKVDYDLRCVGRGNMVMFLGRVVSSTKVAQSGICE